MFESVYLTMNHVRLAVQYHIFLLLTACILPEPDCSCSILVMPLKE